MARQFTLQLVQPAAMPMTPRLQGMTAAERSAKMASIRHDSLACHLCCNFDLDVAYTLTTGVGPYAWIQQSYRTVQVRSGPEEIHAAAMAGCSGCMLLRECALRLFNIEMSDTSAGQVDIIFLDGTALTVHVEIDGISKIMEIFVLEGQPSPWPAVGNQLLNVYPEVPSFPYYGGSARHVQQGSAYTVSLERIEDWIRECDRDHPYCGTKCALPLKAPPAAVLARPPRRLVQVGIDENDLCLADDLAESRPKYVALSYCWGQTRKLVCTKASYKRLRERIPWGELARTVQDAIVITRRLSITYLWVDGLCIIQGDTDDWQDEASNMASIYANAHLTIAASSTTDCDDGCFKPRPDPVEIDLVEQSGVHTIIHARERLSHEAFEWAWDGMDNKFRSNYDASVQSVPLFQRGWCFQERLLSGRIVHFAEGEMIWECLGMVNCECGTLDHFTWSLSLRDRRHVAGVHPNADIMCGNLGHVKKLAAQMKGGNPDRLELTSIPPSARHDTALVHVGYTARGRNSAQIADPKQRWRDLIEQYTRTNFTRSTDTLPALSGLASCWGSMEPSLGQYLAGIWEGDLLRSLLWKCRRGEAVHRSTEYLAPSWSWASAGTRIEFIALTEGEECIQHIIVTTATCAPLSNNRYGPVNSGFLSVRGRLYSDRLDLSQMHRNVCFLNMCDRVLHFIADAEIEEKVADGSEAFLLWVCTDVTNVETKRGFDRSLILVECPGQENTYRRIGAKEYIEHESIMDMLHSEGEQEEFRII